MFFNRKPPEPPKPVDRIAMLNATIHEAVANALSYGADRRVYREVAEALESHAKGVRFKIAMM